MNSTHDLGGMHGFEKIDRSQQKNFSYSWEESVFGLTLACGMLGQWNLDESRFARESMEPGEYLKSSYYEHWLHGLETLLLEKGLVTESELSSGVAEARGCLQRVGKEQIPGILAKGGPTELGSDVPPKFEVGDTVKILNFNPKTHTRAPRYIRGRSGIIQAYYGAHVFPDHHAKSGEKIPAHLYSVVFAGRELWGENDTEENTSVIVDVFEPYMEIPGEA